MVAAIKQHVTVDPDGNIVIRGTDLTPGTRAEVIVLVEPAPSPPASTEGQARLAAFRALQAAFNLDRASAERWSAETRSLREWNRPKPGRASTRTS